ncbi:translation initiation factor IF-2 [Salinisphaera sp. USBA-960]|uniref:translation initiation factor IF-2 n=1 Tax=Salinisphaera orenii TaxID=856731 RepID=UPI000DBE7502|nr:translation initiation factor IF-2 [Salifodinibacter halophilus]NNC25539.1 translation initiation factor IF-2 [Salifodinibacter halophilus]
MADTTVNDLANEVGIPVERLVTRLADAGVDASQGTDVISGEDKLKLLRHLRDAGSGGARKSGGTLSAGSRGTVSVQRRSNSEMTVNTGRGSDRGRTVNVEVRKRRTYAGRSQAGEAEPGPEADESAPAAETQAPTEAPEPDAPTTGEAPVSAETVETAADAEIEAESTSTESETPADASSEQAGADQEDVGEPVDSEPELEAEPAPEPESAPVSEPESTSASSETASKTEAASDAGKTAAGNTAADNQQPAGGGRRRDAARSRAQENLERAAKSHGRTEADAKRDSERKNRRELHVADEKRGQRRSKSNRRGGNRSRQVNMSNEHGFERPTAPVVRDIEIPETITVADLAQSMAVKSGELLKRMMKLGVMATINQTVDQETATILVEEMGHTPKPVASESAEDTLLEAVRSKEQQAEQQPRAPVVTIMGHVDHGKTSLLDYIRRTRVTAGESGGITQHIGAYHVEHDKGAITFIDTPGHAAFTKMRARGAETTDVAILIVAADDGVMPQTRESIEHARAADVPMVVAVTKSDLDSADSDKVKSGLSAENIIPEEWGGETQVVEVSSETGAGVDDLLDAVTVQAELAELAAPVDVPARGTVIESSLEKGRGSVATILVQAGTLKRGDTLLAGSHHGRVRALFDERGDQIKSARPSIPVEVLGLSGTPEAGDDAFVVSDEKRAREIAEQRDDSRRENKLARQQAARLDEVFSTIGGESSAETKDLNLIVKGDVQGSVEALIESLHNIPAREVKIRIVGSGVGGISESDIELASASSAIIIGFNVRADAKAKKLMRDSEVDVRYYSVIYEAIEDVTAAINGLLGTELREEIIGVAGVRNVFRSSKLGAVAGCLVEDGAVVRSQPIRVLRNNTVVYEGELESLRRHKDDVERVEAGTECGIGVKNYNDIQPGDQIEVYERTEVQRSVGAPESA